MPIPMICACAAKLRVSDRLRGMQIQCPRCLTVHQVAGTAASNGHAAAPPPLDDVLEASGLTGDEQERLRAELQPDEALVWAGKPVARNALIMGAVFSSVFFFQTIVLVIILIVAGSAAGWIVGTLLGIVALVAALAGIACPFYNKFRYVHSAYGLTNRRALVWDRDWFLRPRFVAYGPEDVAQLTAATFSRSADAVGHLVFARERVLRLGEKTIYRDHGFFYQRNVRALEKLVREQLVDPYTDRLYKS